MPILNNFGPIIISSTNSSSITLDNCAVENVMGIGSAKIYVNNKMSVLGKVKFQNSNNVSFGMNGSVITASALAGSGANFVLSNDNGISFNTTGSVVTASYTVPTDYFSSNQSSLLQLTANNSLSLGVSYTSHTHSQYLNTSQSTVFLTNQTVQPISLSASNGTTTLSLLQLGTENGLTLYHSNGSILGSNSIAPDFVKFLIPCGEVITSHTPVAVVGGLLYKLNATDPTHQFAFVGFSETSGTIGQQVRVNSTKISLQGWGLIPGQHYLAGVDGQLVTDNVTPGAFTKVIGYAADANTMIINTSYSPIIK